MRPRIAGAMARDMALPHGAVGRCATPHPGARDGAATAEHTPVTKVSSLAPAPCCDGGPALHAELVLDAIQWLQGQGWNVDLQRPHLSEGHRSVRHGRDGAVALTNALMDWASARTEG